MCKCADFRCANEKLIVLFETICTSAHLHICTSLTHHKKSLLVKQDGFYILIKITGLYFPGNRVFHKIVSNDLFFERVSTCTW